MRDDSVTTEDWASQSCEEQKRLENECRNDYSRTNEVKQRLWFAHWQWHVNMNESDWDEDSMVYAQRWHEGEESSFPSVAQLRSNLQSSSQYR